MRSFNFCNNCGKNGHLYQYCNDPITSVGVIAYKKDDKELKYLMICRKDTLGYIDFLRGRYTLNNIEYISSLIDIMTNDEKKLLLIQDFENLWSELWGSNVGIQYRGEESSAKEKFLKLKKGYFIDNIFYNLEKIIKNSISCWIEPEWGFPKGRRNYQEKDLFCGLREWSEETGYDESSINIITNILPYEEIFIGSNYKCYKHKYYIGSIKDNDLNINNFQETEVSKVEWKTFQECKDSIRNYNLEKINLIEKVNAFLTENNLCI